MKKPLFIAISLFLFFLSVPLSADFRYYSWTYQFVTMPPGAIELEVNNTYTEPKKGVYSSGYWERQYEIETGLLDRVDFSFYMTDARVTPDDMMNTTEIKLRSRIKLTEKKDDFFVDPLLYIEYRFRQNRRLPDTWEIRGVIAKDMGPLHSAINLFAEEVITHEGRSKKFNPGYAAGVSYAVIGDRLRLGIESTGDFNSQKYFLGPAVSYKGRHLWAVLTPAFGLTDKSDYIKVQFVIGVVFDMPEQ